MFFLYFSLSSSYVFLSILKNNNCLSIFWKKNFRLHSENFFSFLEKELKKNNILMKDINKIYCNFYPGSQTSLRISLAFLITLQTINKKLEIFHIDSLFLQSNNKDCISLITIDSKKSKFYLSILKNKKEIIKNKIVSKIEFEKIKKNYKNFIIYRDFKDLNGNKIFKSFNNLKNYFYILNINKNQFNL